mmetsp:Transcript_46439/g.121886  ORF Transcript_46439/g.121886 Transcript_46439/m.121886 type:complete len:210 (+) Transcript_46439:116-745(+)
MHTLLSQFLHHVTCVMLPASRSGSPSASFLGVLSSFFFFGVFSSLTASRSIGVSFPAGALLAFFGVSSLPAVGSPGSHAMENLMTPPEETASTNLIVSVVSSALRSTLTDPIISSESMKPSLSKILSSRPSFITFFSDTLFTNSSSSSQVGLIVFLHTLLCLDFLPRFAMTYGSLRPFLSIAMSPLAEASLSRRVPVLPSLASFSSSDC